MKKIIINNDINTINVNDLNKGQASNIVVKDSLGILIGIVNEGFGTYRVTYKDGSSSHSFNSLEGLMRHLSNKSYTFHLLD